VEKLVVKNLGPIKDFTMETNRLTVIIGPQASGKSLLMQFLYYFRNIKNLAAERYVENIGEEDWVLLNTDVMLFGLRGASLGQFSKGRTGVVKYYNEKRLSTVHVHKVAYPAGGFRKEIIKWKQEWDDSKKSLQACLESNSVFIPSERYLYSIFVNRKISVLYEVFQSIQMVKFTDLLESIKSETVFPINAAYVNKSSSIVEGLQSKALGGSITVSQRNKEWLWHMNDGDEFLLLQALSSGQMSTWPFFAIAKEFVASNKPYDFYFEEPETHLHPNAQVEVVKTIAYLISRGHRFVITTHSPFILYVINNLIQAHIAHKGNPPDGEFSIDPDHVAAYCLGDNPRSIVKPDTKLLELREIDSVFDKLNVDFGKYLDMEFARDGE
jgi:hypothetical protein